MNKKYFSTMLKEISDIYKTINKDLTTIKNNYAEIMKNNNYSKEEIEKLKSFTWGILDYNEINIIYKNCYLRINNYLFENNNLILGKYDTKKAKKVIKNKIKIQEKHIFAIQDNIKKYYMQFKAIKEKIDYFYNKQ